MYFLLCQFGFPKLAFRHLNAFFNPLVCQSIALTTCHFVNLAFGQIDYLRKLAALSTFLCVKLPFPQLVFNANLSFGQITFVSLLCQFSTFLYEICFFVIVPLFHSVNYNHKSIRYIGFMSGGGVHIPFDVSDILVFSERMSSKSLLNH
jgi:hypothetical protein